ncbi:MAG: 3-phosphoshikimate 1-carboxyvinyltransferase, partial [Actinomycetota bacterium]
ADGTSELLGLPHAHDVRSTAACLLRVAPIAQPGLESWLEGRTQKLTRISGGGFDALAESIGVLDCGNSGTSMRLLAGLLAGRPFRSVLDGDESLKRRPMERVAEPLRAMRADVRTEDGHAPITVGGGSLEGSRVEMTTPSAQVKGAILLAGVQADGTTEFEEPSPTRDHTERTFEALGAPLERAGGTLRIRRFQHEAFGGEVPGDLSAAAFLLCAAAIREGSEITVEGVGTNPSRLGFVDVLRRAGAEVEVDTTSDSLGEPIGTLHLRARELAPFTVGAEELPRLIDEVPALAALAAHAPGTSRFDGAGELRLKESDRLAGLAESLRLLGGNAQDEGDTLVVEGGGLAGGHTDGQDDHRLAMALAVAALGAREPSVVEGAEWAAISFPGFVGALDTLGGSIEEVQP